MLKLAELRKLKIQELSKVSEVVQRGKFLNFLNSLQPSSCTSIIPKNELKQLVDSVASYLGQGFYTIGPCGEELLAASSFHLRPTDASALHYRHVANSICRQLVEGKSIEDITLARTRGFTVSTLDPVTGGKHCSIGGSPYDFLVTSTLASQAPPALGRALGFALASRLVSPEKQLFRKDSLSYVSLGDGSINNAHFLAATNMARYAAHRNLKCPIVFGVSDNGKCISLRGHGYVQEFVKHVGMNTFRCDGRDVQDVYRVSGEAFNYSRSSSRPSLILYENLPRRFGHAATDRQSAYMTAQEIEEQASHNPLESLMTLAVDSGAMTKDELTSRASHLFSLVETCFDQSSNEPKLSQHSRKDISSKNSAPLVPRSSNRQSLPTTRVSALSSSPPPSLGSGPREPMRKLMTRVWEEVLAGQKDTVYIGEDVEHGGYYLVTEGLASKFPQRVRDIPPDETSLVGIGMGFSQTGLVPIVEIPYAKYLDCGFDMLMEACISHWLSDGNQPNGMIVRLQGFDKGIFGGNFHTHNSLSIPPGLDVVCFSNGKDYVRGARYAMRQARGGRVVMMVDSTDLLNRRHLDEKKKDEGMLFKYPELIGTSGGTEGSVEDDELTFDDVIVYSIHDSVRAGKDGLERLKENEKKVLLIVSYGNGVPTSLLAQQTLSEGLSEQWDVIVVDCPYLSSPPKQLTQILSPSAPLRPTCVLFADVCKEGSGMPLGGIALALQKQQLLKGINWGVVGAENTYNPLGCSTTFLSQSDIESEAQKLVLDQRTP